MIGSDDVLACFIAGNVFTWDDWFRLETMDDSLQPTIDMLLNVGVFMWFGAVCPWHMFVANSIIPIYRLIPLGILVLLLRRLPMILAFQKGIHQVEDIRRAMFLGFFGPIGVSAVFYLYISKEFLRRIVADTHEREDAARLSEMLDVVVWFLVFCSIVVHGLSIPVGKVGFHLPRTISTALSSERLSFAQSSARDDEESHNLSTASTLDRVFRRRRPGENSGKIMTPNSRLQSGTATPAGTGAGNANRSGLPNANTEGSLSSKTDQPSSEAQNGDLHPQISIPLNPRSARRAITDDAPQDGTPIAMDPTKPPERSIRFGDE